MFNAARAVAVGSLTASWNAPANAPDRVTEDGNGSCPAGAAEAATQPASADESEPGEAVGGRGASGGSFGPVFASPIDDDGGNAADDPVGFNPPGTRGSAGKRAALELDAGTDRGGTETEAADTVVT